MMLCDLRELLLSKLLFSLSWCTPHGLFRERHKFGGGCPKVLEPRTLTVRRSYPIQWKRERVDLAELANLRWIKKWRIERIAAHLDLGTTSVKRELAKIRSQKGQMSLDKRIQKAIDQEAVRGFRGC